MHAAVLPELFLCIVKINSVQMSRLKDNKPFVLFMFPSSSGTAGLDDRGSPRENRPSELQVSRPASIQDALSAPRSACSHEDQFPRYLYEDGGHITAPARLGRLYVRLSLAGLVTES